MSERRDRRSSGEPFGRRLRSDFAQWGGRALAMSIAIAVALLGGVMGVGATSAMAGGMVPFGQTPFTASPSTTQAGYPDLYMKFTFENRDELHFPT